MPLLMTMHVPVEVSTQGNNSGPVVLACQAACAEHKPQLEQGCSAGAFCLQVLAAKQVTSWVAQWVTAPPEPP